MTRRVLGKRRGNGEGSIFQRKSDARWCARLKLPDGTYQSFYSLTRQDVERRLFEARRNIADGLGVPKGKATVGHVVNRWIESRKPHLRPTTLRGHLVWINGRLLPGLGSKLVTTLTPGDVEAYLSRELASGLSARSVQYIRTLLRASLTQAVRDGLVSRNVAALINPSWRRSERPRIEVLTPEQVGLLLRGLDGERFGPLILLALATGMRQGELLGLCWDAVDLHSGTVDVHRTLFRDREKGVYVLEGEVKTAGSRRTLHLPSVVLEALKKHQGGQGARRDEFEKACGEGSWGNTWGLVFTREDGAPLNSSVVTHQFQQLLTRLGLPHVRFHDLRHSTASLLIHEGAEMRDVMEQLGHSSIKLTSDTYTHLFDARRRQLAAGMNGILTNLAGAPEPQLVSATGGEAGGV